MRLPCDLEAEAMKTPEGHRPGQRTHRSKSEKGLAIVQHDVQRMQPTLASVTWLVEAAVFDSSAGGESLHVTVVVR
jgi:hypothetical protein